MLHRGGLVFNLLLFLVFICVVVCPGPAGGQTLSPKSGLIFILDASGSMWGRIDEKPKITLAKEVLVELIDDLPEGTLVGLVAYGHRNKGDCQDVEELIPLGPLDKAVFTRKMDELKPLGKTPLTLAVRLTGEKLKTVNSQVVIIVISDGRETCEGDPCATVRELRAAGGRFTVQVIGFKVTQEDAEQLACLAESGGGQYQSAENAQELKAAVEQAIVSVPGGFIHLEAFRQGNMVSSWVEVYPSGEEDMILKDKSATKPEDLGISVSPGVYDLKVIDGSVDPPAVAVITGVKVDSYQNVKLNVTFEEGYLTIKAVRQGNPLAVWFTIYEAGQTNALGSYWTEADTGEGTMKLAPGSYDVKVEATALEGHPVKVFRDITITKDASRLIEVEF